MHTLFFFIKITKHSTVVFIRFELNCKNLLGKNKIFQIYYFYKKIRLKRELHNTHVQISIP